MPAWPPLLHVGLDVIEFSVNPWIDSCHRVKSKGRTRRRSSAVDILCVSRGGGKEAVKGPPMARGAPSPSALTWRKGPAAPHPDSSHHAGDLQCGPAHQQVSSSAASRRCPWCRSTCTAPDSPPCWQCRSSAFAGTRAVKAAFTSAQPSSGRAQLVVRAGQGGCLGRRCVAHLPLRRRPRRLLQQRVAGRQAGRRAVQCAEPCPPPGACVQVYAKGKQRMRTGGNTRMTQQMQQQMVRGLQGGSGGGSVAVACTVGQRWGQPCRQGAACSLGEMSRQAGRHCWCC